MDTSSENLDESMQDVIQRAEAFITAHSFLNREAERSSSNIFDASGESFRTAPDESSFANDSGSNTSGGGPSSSGVMDHSSDNSNIRTVEPQDRDQDQIEVLSDDSQSTVPYDVNISPRNPPTDNDDCFVIEVPAPVVNLCSPYVDGLVSPRTRRARRRRADAAPVVESINLDDTVAEAASPAIARLSHSSPKKRIVAAPIGGNSAPSDNAKSLSGTAAATPSVACPICLESIFHQQAASTICGHLFCKECIYQEIQIRRKCPMCKRALKRHQVHPIYFN
ncbi:uncharacterized protein LOC134226741 [Armigeres subalbatus]|uniref:uncharacterized protein LOC134226741 n=1 Tax=Armigeres subalbatus TaxID=124917 RepID=UPI002ED2831F